MTSFLIINYWLKSDHSGVTFDLSFFQMLMVT